MKKSRNTRQRTVILEILRQTRSHPSAEMIYVEARKAVPNISLGTVYRNLGFLRDQGLVREIRSCDSTGSRFEAAIPPHAHFHCGSCNAIHDIPLPDSLHDFGLDRAGIISSIRALDLHVIGACVACGAEAQSSSAPN